MGPLRAVTTNTSLAKGRDPRYLTAGAEGGHTGGTRYYTEAAGEPPGQWGGRGADALGLVGVVDPDVLQALYVDRVGPDGQRLDARARARYRPVGEREDLAVEAHLALHPLATEGDLEAVRAAEPAKSVSVLHASYLVAARQACQQGARADAEKLETAAADIVGALMAAARAAV